MSPISIIDRQRRLAEAGRIRLGEQVPTSTPGKKRPKALTRFRVTSHSQRAIAAVATAFGGQAQPWADAPSEGQWEVYTEASEIAVAIPPEHIAFEQWFEEWSGGRCRRRCDGQSERQTGAPCLCDPDDRACKPVTRLRVMIRQLEGIGLWRLEAHGYNAAEELLGTIDMAQLLAEGRDLPLLPGTLRIEARSKKVADPRNPDKTVTRNYVVPVLDLDINLSAMGALTLGAAAPPAAALVAPQRLDAPELPPAPGLTPLPAAAEPAPSVREQMAAVEAPTERPRRSNAPPPIPATGLAPRPAAEAEAATTQAGARSLRDSLPKATPEQLHRLEAAIAALPEPCRLPCQDELTRTFGPSPTTLGAAEIKAAIQIAEEWPTGEATEPAEQPAGRRRRPPAKKSAATKQATPRQPAPARALGDDPETRASDGMVRDLLLAVQRHFPERAERLRFAANVLGRDITTFKALTPREANRLMRTIHDMTEEQ